MQAYRERRRGTREWVRTLLYHESARGDSDKWCGPLTVLITRFSRLLSPERRVPVVVSSRRGRSGG
jgi:hypothetical protein